MGQIKEAAIALVEDMTVDAPFNLTLDDDKKFHLRRMHGPEEFVLTDGPLQGVQVGVLTWDLLAMAYFHESAVIIDSDCLYAKQNWFRIEYDDPNYEERLKATFQMIIDGYVEHNVRRRGRRFQVQPAAAPSFVALDLKPSSVQP